VVYRSNVCGGIESLADIVATIVVVHCGAGMNRDAGTRDLTSVAWKQILTLWVHEVYDFQEKNRL